MATAGLEKVSVLAVRLLVMREGEILSEVDLEKVSVEDIGLLVTGSDYKGI